MTSRSGPAWLGALAVAVSVAAAGCSSDESGGIECRYTNPAVLAGSWPKFRRDLANTGHLPGVDLARGSYRVRWTFPPSAEPPRGSFAASPVLNADESVVYVGSSDGNLYALAAADGALLGTPVQATAPITATALAARRFGVDALFVAGGDGTVSAVDGNGTAQPQVWPLELAGYIAASPTTNGIDGSIYVVSLGGQLIAACPNGALRFVGAVAATQSSIAFGPDRVFYVGGNDRLLRAITWKGAPAWTFAASAPILASPVVDARTNTVFVADRAGRIFRVNPAGQPVAGFGPLRVGPVSGSPALAAGTLYVPSEDGTLYAADAETGTVRWTLPLGGPLLSSPAVATGAAGPPVIVVAASAPAGSVYVVADAGASPRILAVCRLGPGAGCGPGPDTEPAGVAIDSSPAIDAAGTIYIGGGDGRVYAFAGMAAP